MTESAACDLRSSFMHPQHCSHASGSHPLLGKAVPAASCVTAQQIAATSDVCSRTNKHRRQKRGILNLIHLHHGALEGSASVLCTHAGRGGQEKSRSCEKREKATKHVFKHHRWEKCRDCKSKVCLQTKDEIERRGKKLLSSSAEGLV